MAADTKMNNQNTLTNIKQIQIQGNAMISEVICKVMISGGILKSSTIFRRCNAGKNRIVISKG